jgi:hypothetical protein
MMRIPGRGRSEVVSGKQKAALVGFPTGGCSLIAVDQSGGPPYAGLSAALRS